MREVIAAAVLGTALFAGTAVAAAPRVVIEDAVARVTVIPENRSDIQVEFAHTNAELPMTIERHGDRVVVEGHLGHNRIRSCLVRNGVTRVDVRGVGPVDLKDMPHVVIRTPRDVDVAAGGAVFGDIGRSNSVELDNAGCGDWTIANTQGELDISQAGSGDTRAGTAGSAHIRIAGSGDISIVSVARDLRAEVAGSGDIHAGSIGGDLKARVAGSGDIRVENGRARTTEVSIAGSGDVRFGGVSDTLEARVMGSGDVSVARVTGAVHKQVMGSGEVSVGQ